MPSIFDLTCQWAKDNKHSFWQKPRVSSTNERAKDEAFQVKAFKIYLTDHQTAGRGRNNNSWSNTSSGAQLLSTWAYTTKLAPQHILPPLIGLALFNAVREVWSPLEWSLKAPNDLYLKDKKAAGLLVENIQQGDEHFVGVGLGFNVTAAPQDVGNSTYLTSKLGTGEALNSQKWFQFLDQLQENFKQAIQTSTTSQIPYKKREELLTALNSNPWKTEIYLEVTNQGDLVSESQTLSWKDI